jgi:hypothetical protein
VHDAEFPVDEVEAEETALTLTADETQAFRCPVAAHVEGLAGLYGRQDANQSSLDTVLECQMAGHVLLGQRGLPNTPVRTSGAAGDGLSMTLELGGTLLDEGGEDLVQHMVSPEELVEGLDATDRAQRASEDQPVQAAEYTD